MLDHFGTTKLTNIHNFMFSPIADLPRDKELAITELASLMFSEECQEAHQMNCTIGLGPARHANNCWASCQMGNIVFPAAFQQ